MDAVREMREAMLRGNALAERQWADYEARRKELHDRVAALESENASLREECARLHTAAPPRSLGRRQLFWRPARR